MSDVESTEAEGQVEPMPPELEAKLDEIVDSGPIEQGRGDGHPRVQTQPGGPIDSQPGGTLADAQAGEHHDAGAGRSDEWPSSGGSGAG